MKRYELIKKMTGEEMVKFFDDKLEIADEVCKECRFRKHGECPCEDGDCMIPEQENVRTWLFTEVGGDR